jgi:hypothetical protein
MMFIATMLSKPWNNDDKARVRESLRSACRGSWSSADQLNKDNSSKSDTLLFHYCQMECIHTKTTDTQVGTMYVSDCMYYEHCNAKASCKQVGCRRRALCWGFAVYES